MTNEEKKVIESEILKHKAPHDARQDFAWNGDAVSFSGSLYIYSNATLSAPNLTSIGGYLSINSNATLPNLTSIGGSLHIYSNATLPNLTSIGGYLSINSNATLSAPNLASIGGSLYIYSNATLSAPNLTSIGGSLSINSNATLSAPNLTSIGGSLHINSNATLSNLTSIGGYLHIYSNSNATLPNLIHKDFVKEMADLEERFGFIKADGIGLQFTKKRKHAEFTIYSTPFIGNYAFVVTDGEHSAHASSIKRGIIDIRFKKMDRNADDYRELTTESLLSYEDAIIMYRVITGACSGGTEQFLNAHPELTVRKKYTVKDIIEKTAGQYGNESIKGFFAQGGK